MTDARWSGDGARPESSFDDLAGGYAAFRPSYPRAAIAEALHGLGARARVLDLGCGTGISSRLFAEAGALVIGIDPSEPMLAEARRVPSLEDDDASSEGGRGTSGRSRSERRRTSHAGATPPEYRTGTAERTGLAAGSRDLVVCAQSFHWFDGPSALAEIHRVLRPGGRLALLYNERDRGDEAARAYQAVMDRAQDEAIRSGRTVSKNRAATDLERGAGGLFGAPRSHVFPNPQVYDRETLKGRARSASYFPADGPLRARLEADLDALFDAHARDGALALAHVCILTISERLAPRS